MNSAAQVAMRRRVVLSSTIGNALEWFDFIIFGLFAEIIGTQFFPKADPAISLLAAYGLLAVAYVARPIGGLFFGAWADRVGRKRTLVTIVLSMAFGTALIGILPTYNQIGIAAPLLLLAARLIQGFSAGGEFGTSTAMLIEFAPPGRRGFYASFQFVAQALAFASGAAISFVLHKALTPESLQSWGWRLPFLAGIIIGPIGFYLRRAVDETPEFKAFLAKLAGIPNTPLRDVLTDHPRALIALLLVIAGMTAHTYIVTIFLPNYVASELGLNLVDAQFGVLALNIVAVLVLPFVAALSDRVGRLRMMMPAVILYIIVMFYLARRLVADPSTPALWILIASSIIIMFATGPAAALSLEMFPVNVRSTGASIVYNFAVAVFGGLTPLLTGWLYRETHDKMSPFYYLACCLALTLLGLAVLSKKPPP